jgi:subtilisin family serine protease
MLEAIRILLLNPLVRHAEFNWIGYPDDGTTTDDDDELPEIEEAELERIYNTDRYEWEFVPGEVIVGMKYNVKRSMSITPSFIGVRTTEIINSRALLILQSPLEEVNETALNALLHSRAIYSLKLETETRESVLDAIEILKKDLRVAFAEPNYIGYPCATPNDPVYLSGGLWGMDKIQAPQAWDYSTGSHSVKVGVLDTGIDFSHVDLASNVDMSLAYYVAQGTTGPYADVMDYDGHGTHVSGVLGAVGNNGVGVVGVNWAVTMAPLKIVRSNSNTGAPASNMAGAILYA